MLLKQLLRITTLILITFSISWPSAAVAGTVTFQGCSTTEKGKINDALYWLKTNQSRIDSKMGQRGLMAWPGSSRQKFIAKLKKNLIFACVSTTNQCQVDENDTSMLLGKVIPVFQQNRVQLCTNNIRRAANDENKSQLSLYAHVIAHEIAHLIRLNAHRPNCVKKYENPRFSKSVGLAVENAYRNTNYQSSYYTANCP